MAEKIYLVNPETASRHRINDCKPSPKLSSALKFSSGSKHLKQDLPIAVDLSSKMTAVETQEDTAACVGNALAAAYEFLIKKRTGLDIDVSRLFIYYNGRIKDGYDETNMDDSGCSIASGIQGLKEYGCCKEELFPYDINQVNTRPSKRCYEDAVNYRITNGVILRPNLNEMKSCLAQGYPFIFGLKTFKSFSTAETNGGLVPMPEPDEDTSLEHHQHAMLAVGYDDQLKQFIVKNSWGPQWGHNGYCYIPYAYMCNEKYCSDLHTIKTISERTRQRREQRVQNAKLLMDQKKNIDHTKTANNQINQPTMKLHVDACVDDDDDDDDEDDDDEDDKFKNSIFWKTERSSYIQSMTKKNQELLCARQKNALKDNQTQGYFENIQKPSKVFKFYILWIDKKTEHNARVADQLTADPQIHIDFCDTYCAAESHIEKNINKIKLNPSTFQIICRGYYQEEKKNPLDLSSYLDKKHLNHIPIIIFTHDKHGLIKHLEDGASSSGYAQAKERFYITTDSNKLLNKCRSNTAKKDGNHISTKPK